MDKLRAIKLFAMDVDGVLTDGAIVIGPTGETKIFHVLDGLGINLALTIGIEVAWITGNRSHAVAERARQLMVREVHQGARFKSVVLKDLAARHGVTMDEIAYMGDDLNDLPALELAGVTFAPANAVPEVKSRVDFVTERSGGDGAVREAIEMILNAQGRWQEGVQAFLDKLKSEQGQDEEPGAVA